MMQHTEYFQFTYWANLLIISRLMQHDVNGNVPSLVSHILRAQQIWNKRMQGEVSNIKPFAAIPQSDWISINAQNTTTSLEIAQSHKKGELITYQNSHGQTFSTKIEDILLHLGNHATHHRGQVCSLMRQAGIAPPVTDYIAWVRKGKPFG